MTRFLIRTHFFVAVPANSQHRTVDDIIADASAGPGKPNDGACSVGNPVHLHTAMLEAGTNTQMQHVICKETSMPYTGAANGELDVALGTLATAGPLQRSGKVKSIAVTRDPFKAFVATESAKYADVAKRSNASLV